MNLWQRGIEDIQVLYLLNSSLIILPLSPWILILTEIYLFVSCFRKSQLEEALKLFEFFRDCKEEELWISEKWKLARTTTLGKDVSQITASIQKHKVSYCASGALSLYYSRILEHLCPSVQLVQHLEKSYQTTHYLKCHDQCLEFLKNV